MNWEAPPHMYQLAGPILGTLSPPTWAELGMYFSAVVAMLASGWAASVTRRNGKEANAITAAQAAWKRLDDLEEEMEKLKESQKETATILSAWTVFTEQLFRWGRGGGGEPEPTVPTQLRKQLAHLIYDGEGGSDGSH